MGARWKRACMLLFLVGIVLSGCGGGGGTSGGSVGPFPSKILSWSPPNQYTDGSPLDCVTELDRFEIYISEDGLFIESENETASVSAKDPKTGQLTTSFDLSNLSPFLSQGITYHVSIRAVAMSGLKSDFSPSATFSF